MSVLFDMPPPNFGLAHYEFDICNDGKTIGTQRVLAPQMRSENLESLGIKAIMCFKNENPNFYYSELYALYSGFENIKK